MDAKELIRISFTMTKRRLLNLVCDQKQNHTPILRPRPFSHRLMEMRDQGQPWRGMVPVNLETFGNQEREQEVALRTVPITLKNGNRRVTVNCLLDEGSDTTYVNEDVVNELGLTGEKEPITVKVANDQTIRFMSGTLEIGLESTDGRVDTKITAKTSTKICGGLRAINWIKIQDR